MLQCCCLALQLHVTIFRHFLLVKLVATCREQPMKDSNGKRFVFTAVIVGDQFAVCAAACVCDVRDACRIPIFRV